MPYSQGHAHSSYKSVRALVWGSKVSAAALRSYCDAPSSCAYGAPAATQRSISLSLMQLLLRLPCVARRLGALEICTSSRTMRQSSVAHASGSCITNSRLPAAHRYLTFIRSVKISEFGTLAHRHSKALCLQTLSYSLASVLARGLATLPMTQDAGIACARALEIDFFACLTNPSVSSGNWEK